MSDSLLRYAYIEQPCNACGGSYRVSLQEILMEHRLHDEWQPARPCGTCSLESRQLMWRIPPELVESLGAAWERVAQAAEDVQLGLKVGA